MGQYLAFDLGAESGRAMLGTLDDGTAGVRGTAPLPQHSRPHARRASTGTRSGCFTKSVRARRRRPRAQAAPRRHRRRHLGRRFRAARPRRLAGRQSHATTATRATTACWRRPSPWCRATEIFAQTGVQFMQLNTLYQLYAMKLAGAPGLDAADKPADHARPVQLLADRGASATS